MKKMLSVLLFPVAIVWAACEPIDTTPKGEENADIVIGLDEMARLLASIAPGEEQMGEVYDAVSSSTSNGYDEEYLMQNLLQNPGYGVGETDVKSESKTYSRPLRDLIRESLEASSTKASQYGTEDFLAALESSDIQIYWPYSENWDGQEPPVITFDPEDDSSVNVGYRLNSESEELEEVLVDEELATERPVWVINRNDDRELTTIEMLRKQDPDWGTGGGEIIVTPKSAEHRMLMLKTFTMKKQFDSWFAGASEFKLQAGSVDGFNASTETELKLYQPSITQLTIVVRRKYKNVPIDFSAVLLSDWTDQIENCALLVTEDDGGDQTSWKCSITGKIKSKSYGFDIEIPYRQYDDIAWRGQLSYSYIEAYDGQTGHFGDIDLCFELVEY